VCVRCCYRNRLRFSTRERERVSHLPSCNNKTAIQNVTKMLALFSFQNDREPNVADRSEPK
jgi:hypothetical protein